MMNKPRVCELIRRGSLHTSHTLCNHEYNRGFITSVSLLCTVTASSCLGSQLELEKVSGAGRTWGAVPAVPGLTLGLLIPLKLLVKLITG